MLLAARALISVLGLTFALHAPASAGEDALTSAPGDSAVVVLADSGSAHGIGAGTVVGQDDGTLAIVTAKHVATFGALRIRLSDGGTAPAHVLALSRDQDIALIAATPDAARTGRLHAAAVGVPRSGEAVYAWGSAYNGPAFEPGVTGTIGAPLPDGSAGSRYTLACRLCHRGDSGAGVFDSQGRLIGVYIGYFETGHGRVHVAETPRDFIVLSLGASVPAILASDAAHGGVTASARALARSKD